MFLGGQRAAPYLRSHGLDVHLDAVGGTSPVQMPNNVDWVARTRLLANRLHPRTAVLLFTGNYWRLTSLPADDSVCREWGTAVRAMVTALQDAEVVLVDVT